MHYKIINFKINLLKSTRIIFRKFISHSQSVKRACVIKKKSVIDIKTMLKNNTHSIALKEITLKSKNSAQNKTLGPPSEIYLCALGNGAVSSFRALYMITDRRRYLFNCGEGTQRLANEFKMKLSKLDHIFITHKSWDNIGGLIGLSLTIQDIGVPEITLHGPPGIDLLYENTESFIFIKELDIVTRSHLHEVHVDDCMEVHYIPIFKSLENLKACGNSSPSDSNPSSPSTEHKSKKQRVSKYENCSDVVTAYACKGHSKPGHLLLEKCIEQGVPPGPLLGDLKNGKDVTLPCGKIVKSKDVVSDPEHCPLFLVVECPSESYLDSFVNEEKFECYQKDSPIPTNIASLIVHFTPPAVMKSPKYQTWMKKFPSTTCHMVMNSSNTSLNSIAVHRVQNKLNLLHPRLFSLLQENEAKVLEEGIDGNVVQANTLDRYYLRPAKGLDRNNAVSCDPATFIKEAMDVEGFEESMKHLKDDIKKCSIKHADGDLYPEVTFLGTGSSIPSKVRNVSSILVNTSPSKYFLMDCGEGTHSQLSKLYGNDHRNILLQLFGIFISHMHADHHMGLIQLLKARETAFKEDSLHYEPVVLIGPAYLDFWLKNYHKTFENISNLYSFIECASLEYDATGITQSYHAGIFGNCKDIVVTTVPVIHCADAHGVIITDNCSKWKMVYSGDTVPCERLVDAGKDCLLLIHEATMEDELADEAALKRHSTTSDAIKIGEKMNSRYTILTHFSQRYAKIPVFNENFHNRVGCAFDNMKVQPKELFVLPLLIPTLKCLFAENIEELHIKGKKRRQKAELINSILYDALR